MAQSIEITSEYVPGALGRVVEMHGHYYSRHWKFGAYFEAKVARDMAELLLAAPAQDARLWCAVSSGRVVGSIALDGRQATQHGASLRCFLVDEAARGCGLGRRLLHVALTFARVRSYGRVILRTFAGLDAARHLYEAAGFKLIEEAENATWGTRVLEQIFILTLDDDRNGTGEA
jgi:GNAT superfamily N-acetyltransferase